MVIRTDISVCDTDAEDAKAATLPKAMDAHISTFLINGSGSAVTVDSGDNAAPQAT